MNLNWPVWEYPSYYACQLGGEEGGASPEKKKKKQKGKMDVKLGAMPKMCRGSGPPSKPRQKPAHNPTAVSYACFPVAVVSMGLSSEGGGGGGGGGWGGDTHA